MTVPGLTFLTIQNRLQGYLPEIHSCDGGSHHASVALILEPSEHGISIFFIERAKRQGDPWSGQIAFPGGRREKQDADAQAVAERETLEEVGVQLTSDQCLGRLDDLQGRHGGTSAGMVISCFVYSLDNQASVEINNEVQAVARLPLAHLLEERNRTSVIYHQADKMKYPGIRFGENDSRIVWGLTYRFLCQFFTCMGHDLPE
ncbi:MAG: 8-oxo-dGTP pyrophosphatase MutT (NUDIX family) [Parasphingorhabdus sp.]|jgi:8-oxo-dGTP pyrophosphatase MutT (NUDIX family)